MAGKRISVVEGLRQEVGFLRATLRDIDRYTEAETNGILAQKAGQSRDDNPYSRMDDTTCWLTWDSAWENEMRNSLLRGIVERTLLLAPEILNLLGSERVKELLGSLKEYKAICSPPQVPMAMAQ